MTPLQRWIIGPVWISFLSAIGYYLTNSDSMIFSILGWVAYLFAGGSAWMVITNPRDFNEK